MSSPDFQGGNEEIDRSLFIGDSVGTVHVQISANSTVSDKSITHRATDGKASEISVGSAASRHSIQGIYPSRVAEGPWLSCEGTLIPRGWLGLCSQLPFRNSVASWRWLPRYVVGSPIWWSWRLVSLCDIMLITFRSIYLQWIAALLKQKTLFLSNRQLTVRVHQQICQRQLRLVLPEDQGHSQLSILCAAQDVITNLRTVWDFDTVDNLN